MKKDDRIFRIQYLSAGIENRLYKFYVNTIFSKECNAENELNLAPLIKYIVPLRQVAFHFYGLHNGIMS